MLNNPAAARILPFAVFMGFIALASIPGHYWLPAGRDDHWLPVIRGVIVAMLLFGFWGVYPCG
jgi:uncharacterized BrkB/YihY/UPF0761 family membrane protein